MIHCTDFTIIIIRIIIITKKRKTVMVKTPHFSLYCNFESFQFFLSSSFSNALNILQNQKLLKLNASITHNLVIRSCHESLVIHPQPTECHLLILSVPCYKEEKGRKVLNWVYSHTLCLFKVYFYLEKMCLCFQWLTDYKC